MRVLQIVCVLAPLGAAEESPCDSRPYFRTPSIDAEGARIAFSYAGDIHVVPAGGGEAHAVVTHPAYDDRPRWSPDGARLAFTSLRTGNGDVYVLDLEGGRLTRLTYHEGLDSTEGWSPGGELVYFSSQRDDIRNSADVFAVPSRGGTPYPVTCELYEEEYNAAPSPDGSLVAFNGNDTVRQWWRKGPRVDDATDIWIVRAGPYRGGYRRITTHAGLDSWPMWAPDGKGLYFVSDEGGAENIWYQSLEGGERRRVTSFADGRVLWPSIAGSRGTVVFERDFGIWRLDPGEEPVPVAIRAAADDKVGIEKKVVSADVTEFALSPDGEKVAFVVRGEVFAVPAAPEKEPAFALRVTRTPARESGLAWTADSRSILYSSARHGTPDLYRYDFTSGEETRLTAGPAADLFPVPDPLGRRCAYLSGMTEIRLLDLATGEDRPFISGHFPDDELQGVPPMAWAPDGTWLLYVDEDGDLFKNLFVRALPDDRPLQISFFPHIEGLSPGWSPDGTFVIAGTGHYRYDMQVYRIDLVPSAPAFREDRFEELFRGSRGGAGGAPTRAGDGTSDGGSQRAERLAPAVRIVEEGLRDRARRLVPFVPNVESSALSPDGTTLAFLAGATGKEQVWTADLRPGREDRARVLTTETEPVRALRFSPDGSWIYYLSDGKIRRVPSGGGEAQLVPFKVELEIDFHGEKTAVFEEAWRLLRDHFYDASFRGLVWNEVKERYLPVCRGIRTRRDLVWLLCMLCGELGTSHMGAWIPPDEDVTSGELGVTFDPELLAQGVYRIRRFLAAGPLARADPDLETGDFILAADGIRLGGQETLEKRLEGKKDRKVRLLAARDAEGRSQRTVSVEAGSWDDVKWLRYRRWVRDNERYVAERSGGRVGYVHIPYMTARSLERFRLDLEPVLRRRDGVIVDIRYNSGGFVAPFVIDVLMRRPAMRCAVRDRTGTSAANLSGSYVLDRPTILLQNEQSLSNAEMCSEAYRRLGLGKVLGTSTCGWVVWTWRAELVDGTRFNLPRLSVRTLEGEDLERVSRAPDIFVERPLGEGRRGVDSQLDRAIEELLRGR